MPKRLVSICAAVVATACFSHSASAVTLYTPASGTPAAQGWLTGTAGGTATSGIVGGAYRLDTTSSQAVMSGSALYGSVPLDTAGGFNLSFGLQVLAESHNADNQRGGYSVIVTGTNAARSLEISFWTDRVFVYGISGTTFSPGAFASFDTTAASSYSLTVQNQQYALSANGISLLSGSLVDYSAAGGIYAVGGSVYFGDDTSRAASITSLGSVVLSPVPEPATAGLFLLGGALLAVRKRRPRG